MAYPLYRLPKTLTYRGESRSAFYRAITLGLMTPPVRLSARSVAWPENEILAINAARIAGKSEDDIRRLVVELTAARKTLGGAV